MKEEIYAINIYPGYAGTVNIRAKVGVVDGEKVADAGKEYIMEFDEVQRILLKAIKEKGYSTELKPRQHYSRLVVNQV